MGKEMKKRFLLLTTAFTCFMNTERASDLLPSTQIEQGVALSMSYQPQNIFERSGVFYSPAAWLFRGIHKDIVSMVDSVRFWVDRGYFSQINKYVDFSNFWQSLRKARDQSEYVDIRNIDIKKYICDKLSEADLKELFFILAKYKGLLQKDLTKAQLEVIMTTLLSPESRVLAELKSGEGKTLCIAVLAAYYAKKGQNVDIMTFSSDLAASAEKEHKAFFKELGILDKIQYGTKDDFMSKYSVKDNDRLSKSMLLIDEADSILFNQSSHVTMKAAPIYGMETMLPLFSILIGKMSASLLSNPNITRKEVLDQMYIAGTNYVSTLRDSKSSVPEDVLLLALENMELWCESVLLSMAMRKDVDHIVEQSRILAYESKDSGAVLENLTYTDAVHQILQILNNTVMSPENLPTSFISVLGYISKYQKVSGVTGTIGGLSSFFKNVYDLDSYAISPVHETKIEFENARYYMADSPKGKTKEECWLEDIYKTFCKRRAAGQPTLIVCAHVEDVKKIQAYIREKEVNQELKGAIPKKEHAWKRTLTDAEKENVKKDIARSIGGRIHLYARNDLKDKLPSSLSAGELLIASNLGGRGVDIKIGKNENKAGGLHVILAYDPDFKNPEDQALYRTGRFDNPGSFCKVVCSEYISEEERTYRTNRAMEKKQAEELPKQRMFDEFSQKIQLFLENAFPKKDLTEKFAKQICQRLDGWTFKGKDTVDELLKKYPQLAQVFKPFRSFLDEGRVQTLLEKWGVFLQRLKLLEFNRLHHAMLKVQQQASEMNLAAHDGLEERNLTVFFRGVAKELNIDEKSVREGVLQTIWKQVAKENEGEYQAFLEKALDHPEEMAKIMVGLYEIEIVLVGEHSSERFRSLKPAQQTLYVGVVSGNVLVPKNLLEPNGEQEEVCFGNRYGVLTPVEGEVKNQDAIVSQTCRERQLETGASFPEIILSALTSTQEEYFRGQVELFEGWMRQNMRTLPLTPPVLVKVLEEELDRKDISAGRFWASTLVHGYELDEFRSDPDKVIEEIEASLKKTPNVHLANAGAYYVLKHRRGKEKLTSKQQEESRRDPSAAVKYLYRNNREWRVEKALKYLESAQTSSTPTWEVEAMLLRGRENGGMALAQTEGRLLHQEILLGSISRNIEALKRLQESGNWQVVSGASLLQTGIIAEDLLNAEQQGYRGLFTVEEIPPKRQWWESLWMAVLSICQLVGAVTCYLTGVGSQWASTLLSSGISDFLMALSDELIDWANYFLDKLITYAAALIMQVGSELTSQANALKSTASAAGVATKEGAKTAVKATVQHTVEKGTWNLVKAAAKEVGSRLLFAAGQGVVTAIVEHGFGGNIRQSIQKEFESLKKDKEFLTMLRKNGGAESKQMMESWIARKEVRSILGRVRTISNAVGSAIGPEAGFCMDVFNKAMRITKESADISSFVSSYRKMFEAEVRAGRAHGISVEEIEEHVFKLMMGEVSAGFGGMAGEYAAALGANGMGVLADEIQQGYRESTASDVLKKPELSEREALYVMETYGGDPAKMKELFAKEYQSFLKECKRDGAQPETRIKQWVANKEKTRGSVYRLALSDGTKGMMERKNQIDGLSQAIGSKRPIPSFNQQYSGGYDVWVSLRSGMSKEKLLETWMMAGELLDFTGMPKLEPTIEEYTTGDESV
jgi:hypothetical protein